MFCSFEKLEDNKYAIMSSIDLSSVFNVVNIALLIKRLKTPGLADDLVELIEIWLKDTYILCRYLCHINGLP